MDFSFTEEQIMVRDLARGILEKEMTPERAKEIERNAERFDRRLWSILAGAGLLGLVVPVGLGGMGFGILEVCALLEEVGRVVAPIPVLPTLVLGAMPIAELGDEAQRQAWLPAVAAGKTVLSGALIDAGSEDPGSPAMTAHRDGGRWRLEGEKHFVPAADLAERVVMPARTGDGVSMFLVDPRASGVSVTPQRTSTGEVIATLELSGAPVDEGDRLRGNGRSGEAQARWLYDCAVVGTCATQIGVSEKALQMTTEYVRERVQFGVPIGSFQAVQHRAADAYVDLESMRWVTWRAAWMLADGLPAERAAAIAKFWAAEGGARIASSAQHLHAGIGADLDYPIHRYFLWSKSLELGLGAATPQLVRLGRNMARTRPQELT